MAFWPKTSQICHCKNSYFIKKKTLIVLIVSNEMLLLCTLLKYLHWWRNGVWNSSLPWWVTLLLTACLWSYYVCLCVMYNVLLISLSSPSSVFFSHPPSLSHPVFLPLSVSYGCLCVFMHLSGLWLEQLDPVEHLQSNMWCRCEKAISLGNQSSSSIWWSSLQRRESWYWYLQHRALLWWGFGDPV